jgi:hypothetical protein
MPKLSEVTGGKLKLSQVTSQPQSVAEHYADLQRRAAELPQAGGTGTDGGNFWAGMGKSFVDTGHGLVQLGATASRMLAEHTPDALGGDRAAKFYGGVERKLQAQEAERRQRDQPLTSTGAGKAGEVTGVLAQLLGPGIAMRGTAAGAALLPRTVLGNVAQGVGMGALQPVADNGERGTNMLVGGGLGGLGAVAPKVVGGVARPTVNYLSRFGQKGAEKQAARIIAGESADRATLLRVAPSAIPGVQRSLAEESLDPGIARLERNARSTGQGFDAIDRNNNLLRVNALRTIAGDDTKMSQALDARDLFANGLRNAAKQIIGVDTGRLVGQVGRLAKAQEGRPAIKSGLVQVQQLLQRAVPDAERMKAAIQPLQDFITTDKTSAINRDAAKDAIRQIRAGEWPSAQFGSGAPGTVGVGGSQNAARAALAQARKALEKTHVGEDRVAVLDNVRRTIGDMLAGKYGGDSAAALAGSREMMVVKNQLDRVLAKQAPEYGRYLNAYRQGSKPINRMQLGQHLIDKGAGGSVVDPVTGAPTLTPAAFSRQASNLDAAAATATGFRKARAADILQPQDIAVIKAIQDDLERKSFAGTAGSGGNSHSFERQALENKLGAQAANGIPVLGKFAGVLNRIADRRVQAQVVYLLQNPGRARAVLQSLPADERRVVQDALSRAGGAAGSLTPALAE